MRSGVPFTQIDEMDFVGYLGVMAWNANYKERPIDKHIDEVWPGLMP